MNNPHFTDIADGYWTAEHAAGLNAFLAGDVGFRLMLMLRNEIASSAIRAVIEHKGDAFECGKAAGYQWMLECLKNMAQFSAQPEESQASNPEFPPRRATGEILEQYAP